MIHPDLARFIAFVFVAIAFLMIGNLKSRMARITGYVVSYWIFAAILIKLGGMPW